MVCEINNEIMGIILKLFYILDQKINLIRSQFLDFSSRFRKSLKKYCLLLPKKKKIVQSKKNEKIRN